MANFTAVKKSPTCKQEYEPALFFASPAMMWSDTLKRRRKEFPATACCGSPTRKSRRKKYKTDISRDNGRQLLGDLGFEDVRMVAIDDDWSARRFHRVEFVKSMQRGKSLAISKTGRERVKKNRGIYENDLFVHLFNFCSERPGG